MSRIFINSTEHEITRAELTYEEVCLLAGEKPSRNPSIVYHVPGAGDAARSGTLWAGRSVATCEGMRFSCMVTGGA